MFNENPVNEGNISPLFRAIRDTFNEAQKEFHVVRDVEVNTVDSRSANTCEGFFLPFTPQTGTGKTFSCNLLIFTKLYDLASHRYSFILKALSLLKFIADSGVVVAERNALRAISKINDGKVYLCNADVESDYERLNKTVLSVVEKAEANCNDENLKSEIKTKHKEFLTSLENEDDDHSSSQSSKNIVFITDTRDNVSQSYHELLELIENLCKTKLEIKIMKSMVVIVMGKVDQAKAMGKGISGLVEFIKNNSISPAVAKDISQKYERFVHYHAKVSRSKSRPDKYEEEQFEATAIDIYNAVYDGIRAIAATEKNGYQSFPTGVREQLIALYPASLVSSGRAVVCYMTTAKYLGSIMAVPGRFRFSDDKLSNHILFIDEVDKQHAVVRNKILEADPMLLVRGVKTAAQTDVLHFQQGKDDFKGVGDIMHDAINTLKDVADEWRTQYSYDFDESYDGGNRAAELFSVPGSVSSIVTMSGKRKRVEIIQDDEKIKKDAYYSVFLELADSDPTSNKINKNILQMKLVSDSDGDDNEFVNGFPKVINSLSKAYKTFLSKSVKAVRKIYQNKKDAHNTQVNALKAQKSEFEKTGRLVLGEQWVKVDREPSLISCLNDFTYQLNIDDGVKADIRNKLFGTQGGSGSLLGQDEAIICSGFHGQGCSFDTILRLSDNFVDFENYSIPHSGTGWMASLVGRGTQIVAISATARNKSQIHNFSQVTLKAQLGKRYVEFTKERSLDIYNFYCQKRDYDSHNVNIASRFLKYEPNTLGQFFADSNVMLMKLAVAFPPPSRKGSNQDTNHKTNKEVKEAHKKENSDYLMNVASQLSKMWQAIELFVAHPTNRYMLTFSTRNFGKTPKEKRFFKTYLIKFLEEKYGKKIDIHFAINAEKMRRGDLQKLLTKTMREDGRINIKTIVMTSYASMAAGTNPDCYFHDDDLNRLVYVDESDFKQKKRTMDADCIYLARPSNMFNISDNDDDSDYINTKFKIACLYNIMCLYEGHFIDAHIARKFIRYILSTNDKGKMTNVLASAYASGEHSKMTFENGDDYLASIQMIIEQAVGRTGRTPWKSREVQILADAALAPALAHDERQKHELSHEYFSLREEAVTVHDSGMTTAICIGNPEQRLRRAAIADNKKSLQHFNTEVPKLLGNYRYETFRNADVLDYLFGIISRIGEPTYKSIEESIKEAQQYAIEGGMRIGSEGIWDNYTTTLRNMKNRIVKGKAAPVPPNIVVDKLKVKLKQEAKSRRERANAVAEKWAELREYVLKNPTISESEVIPRFQYVHIEVPRDTAGNAVAEYAYDGIPEIEYADNYEMFTTTKTPKMVSELSSELRVMLGNCDIRKHFSKNGYCLKWKPNTHIVNPAVYCNVYRPALAEQAVEAILSANGFKWSKLPHGLEEKMDGVIEDRHGNKALVDVKFWYCSRVLKNSAEKKMKDTMLKTGIRNIIYINMFKNDPRQECLYKTFENNKTSFMTADFMEVPGIMDKTTFQPLHIAEITKFVSREV
ncbi:hypothetical protein JF50_20190 [Pseudoalteromonas luteoviolacea]|uniref:Uncharacterized protein n=1 Tax=Pseudoalteromonas luteoviolacea TaxID=43657 RepID=A0A0C1Q7P1_9GAMM|nr:hypothetical protein [Pseudoalteromonas luteoviolacea]KID55530.1 hypothetical protein JF50_20190 [Pseudoalteromonas luteoviolacea]